MCVLRWVKGCSVVQKSFDHGRLLDPRSDFMLPVMHLPIDSQQ